MYLSSSELNETLTIDTYIQMVKTTFQVFERVLYIIFELQKILLYLPLNDTVQHSNIILFM
jgi:hypothetical protein